MDQLFQTLYNDNGVTAVSSIRDSPTKRATTTIEKENGFCRAGLPFCGPDPMHAHLLSINEEPAFPDKDDIPTNERFSFDVYYLIVLGKYHRITLTRAHKINGVQHVCFVDGNVVWASSPRGYLLINQSEWKSSFESSYPYRFSFFICEDTKINICTNPGLNAHAKLWQLPITRHPLYYGVFVNNQSTVTGKTVEEEDARGKLCPAALYLLFLLPVWVLWVLFAAFVLNPILYRARSCEVRRYYVEGGEEGILRQIQLVGSEKEIEQSSLLGSIHP